MSTKNENNSPDKCENCSSSFNLIKRKKTCIVCSQIFCQYCVARLAQSTRPSARICNTCKAICTSDTTLDDLLNVKVKHLRAVLNTSNISTSTCKEKRDLADLFLRNRQLFANFSINNRSSTNNTSNTNTNYRTHSNSTHTTPNTNTTSHSNTSSSNNNNNINNNNNSNNNSSSSSNSSSQEQNSLINTFMNNIQGFVSSNLGSVLNPGPVPCPPPPNRANNTNSNHNTSSSSSNSTSSQNFNSFFNIFNEQFPNVFSQFTQFTPETTQTQQTPSNSTNAQEQPAQQYSQQSTQSQTNTHKRRASLTDIKTPQDIDNLTIKQIKEILSSNFVEYKGCCERNELVDKLKRLFDSHYKNKNLEDQLNNPSSVNNVSEINSVETDVCKICMESIMDCVLLECGHMCSCIKCGKQLAECPICRQNVVRIIRVFKS